MNHNENLLLGAALVLLPAASFVGHPAQAITMSVFILATDNIQPTGPNQYALEPSVDSTFNHDVPHTLSQRLGEDIDRDEREYFGLFPEIKDFGGARAFRQSTGGVAFFIEYGLPDSGRDTTLIVTAEVAEQLAAFIEHYEPICARKYSFDHGSIKELAQLPAAICTTTRPVKVLLQNGGVCTAQILHAQDSALMLWKGTDVYDWQTVGENVMSLPYHVIHAITIKENTMRKRGLTYARIGFLIGGAVGAIIGYAAGDDVKTDFGYTAEMKAVYFCAKGALLGSVFGGGVGFMMGVGKGYAIRGNLQTYQSCRLLLNRIAVFPDNAPPEIKHHSEVR